MEYRYGLSFPGQITGRQGGWRNKLRQTLFGASPKKDFREDVVKPIADLMLANCNNNKQKVLYDEYHDGVFARPNLDEYLPKQYRECELIVVFLCEDYARRDWCQREWKVIQVLTQDSKLTSRVMYLWYGPQNPKVLADLQLDWTRDGFRPIDKLTPEEIWNRIYERFEKNQRDKEREDETEALAAPMSVAKVQPGTVDAEDNCWRLLVVVERAFTRHDKQPSYGVDLLLCHPDGRRTPLAKEGRRLRENDPRFSFEELSKEIVKWFSMARLNTFRLEQPGQGAVLVVLALPAEMLISAQLPTLVQQVREHCSPEKNGAENDFPPLLLTCSGICYAERDTNNWMTSDYNAQMISKAISQKCAHPYGRLGNLTWWTYRDSNAQDSPQSNDPAPRHFSSTDGKSYPGHALEDQRLFVAESGNGDDKPHALLIRWRDDLAEQSRCLRLDRVVTAGVPLFLIEPACADADNPTQHPFDKLMGWTHGKLARNHCTYHRGRQPDKPDEALEWAYLRSSLLYWDDHRFRPLWGDMEIPFS